MVGQILVSMSMLILTSADGNGLSLTTLGRFGELLGYFFPRQDFAQNVRKDMTGGLFNSSG